MGSETRKGETNNVARTDRRIAERTSNDAKTTAKPRYASRTTQNPDRLKKEESETKAENGGKDPKKGSGNRRAGGSSRNAGRTTTEAA